ncbi:glutaredoxin domain-containing protein [Actinomadura sp. 7K507]|uniref:glutaredoxin domain-containing protein n=1 Tax=Actinomadura sp. 7K507 TaxID=2530365 RepID=UPI001048D38E|nr:glutaredoxin domain-containing protein [Actinomadura sp. 7K507]TDC98393.1 glutaredoxin [Actinomadura sp. 7K507]
MTETSTVQIFTKPACVLCKNSKRVLDTAGIPYEELDTSSAPRLADSAVYYSGRSTLPQVFAGGQWIDGPDDLSGLAKAGRLREVVESAHGALPIGSVSDEELARGAEDLPLVDHLSRTDGTHDSDPESWPILRFYHKIFGFWPNTLAYLYRWPTAYKLFVYCQNIASLQKAAGTVGTPVVSIIGYGSSAAQGCTYCMTHSITMFKGLDVDVDALKAARRGDTGPDNPFGPFEVAVVDLAAQATRNAVTDKAIDAVRDTADRGRTKAVDPEEALEAVIQIGASMGFFNVFNDLAGVAIEGDWAVVAKSKGIDPGRHGIEDENPDNLAHGVPEGGPQAEEMLGRFATAVGDVTAYTTEHLGLMPAWMAAWPEATRSLHAHMYVTLMSGGWDAVISGELKHLMARVAAVSRGHTYLAAIEGLIAAHLAEAPDRAAARVRHAYRAAIGDPESMEPFDAKEQSALRLAWLSAQSPMVTPRRFVEPLIEQYDERAITELIVCCAVASLVQRFVAVVRPDIEPEVRTFLADHGLDADLLAVRYPAAR